MCVPDQAALGESVRSDAGDAQRACVTATDALRRRRWRSVTGCWGDASHESSSSTVRGTQWFDDKDGDWADDDDYDFGEDWDGYHDDGEADVLGFIQSVKPTKKPHARHSGDHTQTHWWHRRRQKNGKEGTWKQTAEQAGYWMGLVAVALFILIGWAFVAASLHVSPRRRRREPMRAGTTRS